jgi:hypothetical protein
VRNTSRQGKLLKILRIEEENYSHHHDNENILNRTCCGGSYKFRGGLGHVIGGTTRRKVTPNNQLA